MSNKNRTSKKKIRNLIAIGAFLIAVVSFFVFRHQIMSMLKSDKGIYSNFDDARPNVILILVDALRTDSLGCYGSKAEASPNTDAFADQSILFELANSQATCTRRSSPVSIVSVLP